VRAAPFAERWLTSESAISWQTAIQRINSTREASATVPYAGTAGFAAAG
jgi:hypothetical protein